MRLVKRLLMLLPTLLGIHLVAFLLLSLAPGDPSDIRTASLGGDSAALTSADAATLREAFRERYLYDQPLWRRYLHSLGPFNMGPTGHTFFGGTGEEPYAGLLALDFGNEFLRPQVRVGRELARRLVPTVTIAALAVLLMYAVAFAVGLIGALKQGSYLDRIGSAGIFVLYAVPGFWLALMLQRGFGPAGLDWLPTIGLKSFSADASHASAAGGAGWFATIGDRAAHLVLPVVCYAYAGFAVLSRQLRSSLIVSLRSDYVRTARAKGLGEGRIVWAHALRNSLLPQAILFAAVLPTLVGGSVLIESIFDIPGMGRYAYEGLLRRELNVVVATTLCSALMTVVGLYLSEFLTQWADPRTRRV